MVSSSRRSVSLVAVVALLAVSACGAAQPTPVDTLASYREALREGRLADAYRMLSTNARTLIPYERYEEMARRYPDELREAITAFGELSPGAPVTARMELASGEVITLVEEGGRWRIDPSTLEFYGQHTPSQALRSFTRALARERWEVLVRLAPRRVVERLESMARESPGDGGAVTAAEALRRAWTGPDAEGAQNLLRRMRDALDRGRPIEVVGDRASMSYGTGNQSLARLVREDGLWRVEEPE